MCIRKPGSQAKDPRTLGQDPANSLRFTPGPDWRTLFAVNYFYKHTATSRDTKSNLTSYGYDAKGNLTSVTPPSPLGGVNIAYDSLSRISSVTDGKGQTTTYQYDSLDRVTRISYADGSSVVRSYDSDGNPISMTDATGTTTMSYDKFGRLIERKTPDAKQAKYTYDFAGNLLTVADAGPAPPSSSSTSTTRSTCPPR